MTWQVGLSLALFVFLVGTTLALLRHDAREFGSKFVARWITAEAFGWAVLFYSQGWIK